MSNQETEHQNQEIEQREEAAQKRTTYERTYVGNTILQLLESVNWSPADLCRHTDLNSGNLSKVLRGEKGLSAYNLLMVQQAVLEEQQRKRERGSFLNDTGQSYQSTYVQPMCRRMVRDGISQGKVDAFQESVTGIIKGIYTP